MAIRDITLGQYFPGDSPVHRLDPRIKIIATIVYIVSLFLANSFPCFIPAIVSTIAIIAISGVSLSFVLRGVKPVLFIIILTVSINIFMTEGRIIWSLGSLNVTSEGVHRAAFLAVRLLLLIFGSSLLTLLTKPIALTDGIESLLRPLGKVGVPSHELAMMMSIALRFVPTLLEETDKIMKAQIARGADFESGNIISRARALLPLLVPLFVSAFRIAVDLALAMEARCYNGGEGRTRMNALRYGKGDIAAALFMIIYICSIIYLRCVLG